MVKFLLKLSLLVMLLILLPAGRAYAQWPPFDFRLTPSYASGKIKYNIKFNGELDGVMTNVAFKVPLPKGTRFLEANAQETTSTSFDGKEVTFFTTNLYTSIKNASFVVEITDPGMTVFTTHAWIVWEGDQPGNFLTKDIVVDITRQPLNWEAPFKSRLQLETRATVTNDVVTYLLYPKNVASSRVRMQDLKINVPIPEGTTFLSVEAPPAFATNFDGREVTFTTLELEQGVEVAPLIFKVSTNGVTAPTIATHAWATWKNAGKRVGVNTAAQEEITTGDIIVQPNSAQWVAADMIGDVPFSGYDLTSVAFETYPAGLKIIFDTAGDLGRVGEPLEFTLYIDTDCNAKTGTPQNELGADYRIKYAHSTGKTRLNIWSVNDTEQKWQPSGKIQLISPVNNRMVALWAPDEALNLVDKTHFCWLAQAKNNSTAFSPNPPTDLVKPERQDLKLSLSSAAPPTLVEAKVMATKPLTGTFIELNDTWQYLPGWAEPSAAWKTIDFDASAWFAGPTSIGYGAGKYRTNLERTMLSDQVDIALPVQSADKSAEVILAIPPTGDKGSVFMRYIFSVPNPASLTQLILKMKYEGGFVAYLNGVEVARRNLGQPGSPVPFDMPATKTEAKVSEDIDLRNFIANLVAGDNLLAIQAHRTLTSSNLFVAPKLNWRSNPVNPTPTDTAEEVAAPASSAPAAPLMTEISGKLAVPLDNGAGYDVHIFSISDGQEIVRISNARQPNFRFDGQRLLINREGGEAENLFEYNFADGTEKQVSDAPKDSHPFYDSGGNRVVYGNPELTYGRPERVYNDDEHKYYFTGVHKPFIFVQCGLLPPHQEQEGRCRDIPNLGVLVPAGQMGEIQGTNPIWTSNDMIAYKGCNTWAGSRLCGIYVVPSASTKGFSNGFIPRQLTRDSGDIPSDTKGNLIAFTSRRDGNWEAYVMDLNGDGVTNLSNSPDSNDGLPTISPDSNWVAFVSDRDGRWAAWVTPLGGGSVEKLFDLPTDIPWSDGDRAWTNERISWGP